MVKAVLFDLDGTLVNSLGDLAASVNYVLELSGYPTHKTDDYKYFAGDGIPKMLERALPEYARNKDELERCLNLFLKYYSVHYADHTHAYGGITETLDALKAMGIKIAVVSNKAQEMSEIVVKKVFGNIPDLVLGKRADIPAKPDPTMLNIALREFDLQAADALLVGDTGMDMSAAAAAGVTSVGVLWGFRTSEELSAGGAKHLIQDPLQLIEIINASH